MGEGVGAVMEGDEKHREGSGIREGVGWGVPYARQCLMLTMTHDIASLFPVLL